ncbi:hypothetical protein ACTFIY_001282 [Dictyostelium cf. discoideum]
MIKNNININNNNFKSNNEDKNEILFWKVIKNIFLFKRITSFLRVHFRFGYYGYYEIKSVKWMIKYKYYSLLKEKIERGEEGLSFFHYHYQCFKNSKLIVHSIFNVDEPLKSDKSFYRSLFKNYYNYFINELLLNKYECIDSEFILLSNKKEKEREKEKEIQTKDQKQLFMDRLIDYDNHVAYSIIIEDYGLYKPTDDDLIYSINQRSFNISLYLISTNQIIINKSNIDKIWKSILFHIDTTSIELNENNNNNNNKIITCSVNQKIDFLINKLKFQPPNSKLIKSVTDFKFNHSFNDLKLNDLLNSCFSISYFNFSKNQLNNKKKLIEKYKIPFSGYMIPDKVSNEFLTEDYFSLSTDQLQDYKKKFEEFQLLDKLIDQIEINGESTTTEMISNLFKMILPFLNNSSSFLIYVYYLVMLKNQNNNNNIQYSKYLITMDERSLIFSNSNINLNKKIKIINDILNNYRNLVLNDGGSDDSFQINLTLNSIWNEFINYDVNKELMDILFQNFKKFNLIPPQDSSPKSPQMLDYLISINYFYIINYSNFFNNNIEMLVYFKSMYPLEYEKSLSVFKFGYSIFYNDTIDFVIENITDFKKKLITYYIHHSININSYNNYHSNHYDPDTTTNDIKDINNLDKNEREKCLRIINDPLKLKYYLKEGRLNQLILFNYYETNSGGSSGGGGGGDGGVGDGDGGGGSLDLSEIFNEHAIINEICFRTDLKSIETFLSTKYPQRAKWVLYYASLHGSLQVFKYIHNNSNHHWTFKDNSLLPKEIYHSFIFSFLTDTVKIDCSSIKFERSFI